jgi:hypothetical protein
MVIIEKGWLDSQSLLFIPLSDYFIPPLSIYSVSNSKKSLMSELGLGLRKKYARGYNGEMMSRLAAIFGDWDKMVTQE